MEEDYLNLTNFAKTTNKKTTTMLKEILSISGRPGLFKLISHGNNMLVVESLIDKKRTPAYSRDRIMSLGDIAIYTYGDDVPLWQVLETIREKHNGKPVETDALKTDKELDGFFKEILPEYDEDRVYKTDIKKVINWYNVLIGAGFNDFKPQKKEDDKEEAVGEEK